MSTTDARHDIATRADCAQLTRAFYEKAMTDPLIGYLFTDVAQLDLEAHLPVITSFWETILLGAGTYSGGAFAVHASLNRLSPLRPPHFERWLWLWRGTVDELFAGPKADEAKAHANRVARAFVRRLQGLEQEPAAPIAPALIVTRHGGGASD